MTITIRNVRNLGIYIYMKMVCQINICQHRCSREILTRQVRDLRNFSTKTCIDKDCNICCTKKIAAPGLEFIL